jgi:hypothetical protein
MGLLRMINARRGGFGDKRFTDVGGAFLAAMQSQRTMCVHRLAKNRNQTV